MPLQDSDNLIIGRGDASYKITYQDLKDDLNYAPPPTGTIDTPTVLSPNDGAGGGGSHYPKSDAITAIEGGGTVSDGTTGTSISTLNQFSTWNTNISGDAASGNKPLSENDSTVYFTRFGGVQFSIPVTVPANSIVSVAACNEDFAGGHIYFYFSDGTSDKSTQTLPKVNSWSLGGFQICECPASTQDRYLIGFEPKQDPHDPATRITCGMKPLQIDRAYVGSEQPNVQTYGTKLTLAGSNKLDEMSGEVFGTTDTGTGPYTQTPYKLTTTNIESVADASYWNQSQRWRDSLQVVGNFGNGADRAFNGNMSNAASTQTGGALMTFTCPVAFPAGVKLEAKCNTSGGGSHWISVNGGAEFQVFGSDVGATGFHNLPYQPGDEQAFVITFRNNSTGGGTDLTGIRIGGQLLVDNTVAGPGPSSGTTLTFPGDVSTNPDLRYFKAGDVVQEGDEGATDGTVYKRTVVPTSNSTLQSYEDIKALGQVDQIIGDTPSGGTGNFIMGEFTSNTRVRFTAKPGINGTASKQLLAYWSGSNWILNAKLDGRLTQSNESGSLYGNYRAKIWLAIRTDATTFDTYSIGDTLPIGALTGSDAFNAGNFSFFGSTEAQPEVKVVDVGYPDSNTMIVDGGSWTSLDDGAIQDFIGNFVIRGSGTARDAHPVEYAFDGDDATVCSTTAPFEIHFDPPMSFNDKVEFLRGDPTVPGISVQCFYKLEADTDYQGPIDPAAGNWTDLVTGGGVIKEILVVPYFLNGDPNQTTGDAQIAGFKLDGRAVLDNSQASNHVEYQTNGGKGTVVSVDTATNSMLVTDSTDRDERWIIGQSVAGPSIIDDPLPTNDVEFLCSTFATTPKGEDVLSDIIWDIDGTEYDVDTQNPWKPLSNLSPNTRHTVRVKHRGLSLGESAWSSTVSFTTGNTFRSLIDRVSALESNDVIDDATDTALISLIAGLAARIQALEESN